MVSLGGLLWWILKEQEPFKCAKVRKGQKIFCTYEWVVQWQDSTAKLCQMTCSINITLKSLIIRITGHNRQHQKIMPGFHPYRTGFKMESVLWSTWTECERAHASLAWKRPVQDYIALLRLKARVTTLVMLTSKMTIFSNVNTMKELKEKFVTTTSGLNVKSYVRIIDIETNGFDWTWPDERKPV